MDPSQGRRRSCVQPRNQRRTDRCLSDVPGFVPFRAETYQVLSFLTSLAVFETAPDSYRAHQLRAQLLEESKNDEGAIEEYRNVLKRKPDLKNIHFAIGSLYWKEQH